MSRRNQERHKHRFAKGENHQVARETMDYTDRQCRDCYHWKALPEEMNLVDTNSPILLAQPKTMKIDAGFCRRSPPTCLPTNQGGQAGQWTGYPLLQSMNNACAEFETEAEFKNRKSLPMVRECQGHVPIVQ